MILTTITFIIVLGILVLVHELGHFIAAKKAGVKVLEFAFGFPPRIWTKKKGETNYSINAIPLGGYVKMLGELEESKSPRAFENQKPGKRFMISVSGVLMNLVLAWVLLTIGFAVGMSPLVSDPDTIPGKKLSSEVILADIVKDSPASKVDLKAGSIIKGAELNGEIFTFNTISDLSKFTKSHYGQTIKLNVIPENSKELKSVDITLQGEKDAPLGVVLVDKTIIRVPWYKAPYVALRETAKIVELTFDFLKSFFAKLFVSGKVSEEVGGPVAIYTYTGLAVKAGVMAVLQFVALLSVNLALLNILPFPALDGGRIIFILAEIVARKKVVKERIENIIHTAGFVLLIALILLVTYKDILKLF